MGLVSTGPIGRHPRNDMDKENRHHENFNSHKAPARDKKVFREFEESEKKKQDSSCNFTKNQLREEATDDFWGQKNAFDSEVTRKQKKVPEFRNTDIGDSFKNRSFFDDPDSKPVRSNGRGQRGNPTVHRERDARRPE